MRKLNKKLTKEQKERGVVFSSCLSEYRGEMECDTVHEVKSTDEDKENTIGRLLNDKFFNASHFKYNIVRR